MLTGRLCSPSVTADCSGFLAQILWQVPDQPAQSLAGAVHALATVAYELLGGVAHEAFEHADHLGADADFYFAGWNYGMKVGGEVTPETLEPFDIKVYELTESCIHIMSKAKPTMDDMFVDLINLGKIFDVEERADALVEGYKQGLGEILALLNGTDGPSTVGGALDALGQAG